MAWNNKKSKYTANEKKAYYTGMGYRLSDENKAIDYKNPKNKASFTNGYRDAGKKIASNPSKYGPNKRALAGAKKK